MESMRARGKQKAWAMLDGIARGPASASTLLDWRAAGIHITGGRSEGHTPAMHMCTPHHSLVHPPSAARRASAEQGCGGERIHNGGSDFPPRDPSESLPKRPLSSNQRPNTRQPIFRGCIPRFQDSKSPCQSPLASSHGLKAGVARVGHNLGVKDGVAVWPR